MRDFTREQMARVEELSVEFGAVKVHVPNARGLALVEGPDGYEEWLDEDGIAVPPTPPVELISVKLPLDILQRLLGEDGDMGAHRRPLSDEVTARILELLATSEMVTEGRVIG